MSEFYIPDRMKPIVARILALTASDFKQILGVLGSAQPALSIEHLAAEVSKALPKTLKDAGEIIHVLGSMNHVRLRAGRTIEQFVRGISASVEAPAKLAPPLDRAKFFERVSALLSAEALLVSTRAHDLQHNYDRVFVSARVASDIRSVFDQDGNEIQGSMIVHNMHLTYFQEGELKGFFLAMDNTDIAKLRKVLDRADAKTTVLQGLIERAGTQYFESKG